MSCSAGELLLTRLRTHVLYFQGQHQTNKASATRLMEDVMLTTKRHGSTTGADATPVLKPKLLRSVHALNREFLRLVAPSPATRSMGLSAELANAVQCLSEASRRHVAACSFTLFTLQLTDVKFWGTLCGSLAPTDVVPVDG